MKKARTAEKAIAVLLALSLLSCLTACGGKPTAGPTIPSNSSSSDVLDPGGEADTNTSEETPTQGSGDGEVCYLPVKVMGFYDIPEEAANKLGHGSYDETIATYEYDDAGRLTLMGMEGCLGADELRRSRSAGRLTGMVMDGSVC